MISLLRLHLLGIHAYANIPFPCGFCRNNICIIHLFCILNMCDLVFLHFTAFFFILFSMFDDFMLLTLAREVVDFIYSPCLATSIPISSRSIFSASKFLSMSFAVNCLVTDLICQHYPPVFFKLWHIYVFQRFYML